MAMREERQSVTESCALCGLGLKDCGLCEHWADAPTAAERDRDFRMPKDAYLPDLLDDWATQGTHAQEYPYTAFLMERAAVLLREPSPAAAERAAGAEDDDAALLCKQLRAWARDERIGHGPLLDIAAARIEALAAQVGELTTLTPK